jgi:uncharacterized membrane protein (DUF4010 family)
MAVSPFLLTLGISFLIVIGLRTYYEAEQKLETFGTVRTFVFIGLLGFVLFQLPAIGPQAFLLGFTALLLFLLIYYAHKITQKKSPGLIGVLIALLTYATGPVALSAPHWYLVLIAISILVVLHSKGRIRQFSDRVDAGEILTACTFLAIAGVALPLIPATLPESGAMAWLFAMLPITPRQVWLAVVVTTAISYLGYGLQTYLFPRKGLLFTGVVGGVYSSTAAVIVLAKKSRLSHAAEVDAARAILLAVSMMYLRLLALVAIFQPKAIVMAVPPLLALALCASMYAFWLRSASTNSGQTQVEVSAEPELRRNPLELNAAALFAVLFVIVAFVTKLVLDHFRQTGLRALSFLVGFSDITPFVVSVLQGTLGLGADQMLQSVLIAAASNNLLKAAYTFGLGARRTTQLAAPGLAGLAVLSFAYAGLAL